MFEAPQVLEERKVSELTSKLIIECSNALHWLADAMRHPRMSRAELEEAQKHLMRALSIAGTLDPE